MNIGKILNFFTETPYFDLLPQELNIFILSKFPSNQISTFSLVSRKWKHIANETLHRKIKAIYTYWNAFFQNSNSATQVEKSGTLFKMDLGVLLKEPLSPEFLDSFRKVIADLKNHCDSTNKTELLRCTLKLAKINEKLQHQATFHLSALDYLSQVSVREFDARPFLNAKLEMGVDTLDYILNPQRANPLTIRVDTCEKMFEKKTIKEWLEQLEFWEEKESVNILIDVVVSTGSYEDFNILCEQFPSKKRNLLLLLQKKTFAKRENLFELFLNYFNAPEYHLELDHLFWYQEFLSAENRSDTITRLLNAKIKKHSTENDHFIYWLKTLLKMIINFSLTSSTADFEFLESSLKLLDICLETTNPIRLIEVWMEELLLLAENITAKKVEKATSAYTTPNLVNNNATHSQLHEFIRKAVEKCYKAKNAFLMGKNDILQKSLLQDEHDILQKTLDLSKLEYDKEEMQKISQGFSATAATLPISDNDEDFFQNSDHDETTSEESDIDLDYDEEQKLQEALKLSLQDS